MSAKHTPGPWQAANDCGDSGYQAIYTEDGTYKLALVFPYTFAPHDEQMHANARLIAAAPDLLAALQACRELLAHSDVRHYIGAELGEMAQLHSALNASVKALAKATSE